MFIKHFLKQKEGGYTIIETMIAISLFVTVITAGMGALLQANLLHQKSQDMRSILDNMSFIMEEMSRNLRTGTNFHCTLSNNPVPLEQPLYCASGGAVVFEEAHGDSGDPDDQWVYKVESTDGGVSYNISKSIDSGSTWVQLNPTEVKLTSASGFSVLGPEAPTYPNTQQPLVTIRLVGNIRYKTVDSPFAFQTSVSQRVIDN